MAQFSDAVIIYNPNSTGDSPALAKRFADDLSKWNAQITVKLAETKRAGHGEEIAEKATKQYGSKVLIVSVSGDGGYHEVINGVMAAVTAGSDKPYCAVLPGGNANDHYTNVYDRPLIEAIQADTVAHLDLLQVKFGTKQRFAHSYVGLGISPLVAIELNKHDLSAIKEMWLAWQTFWKFRPFTIEINGRSQTFDSLVIGNVQTMAKHVTLDDNSRPDDGKFEVVHWPHGNKLRFIQRVLAASLGKGSVQSRKKSMQFIAVKPMPMQLDGEVIKLASSTKVSITNAHQALKTFR